MEPQFDHSYLCPICGEPNEILIDLSAGRKQEFTEDCAICCAPHTLTILVGRNPEEVSVTIEPER